LPLSAGGRPSDGSKERTIADWLAMRSSRLLRQAGSRTSLGAGLRRNVTGQLVHGSYPGNILAPKNGPPPPMAGRNSPVEPEQDSKPQGVDVRAVAVDPGAPVRPRGRYATAEGAAASKPGIGSRNIPPGSHPPRDFQAPGPRDRARRLRGSAHRRHPIGLHRIEPARAWAGSFPMPPQQRRQASWRSTNVAFSWSISLRFDTGICACG
jgi:hypothetical protein